MCSSQTYMKTYRQTAHDNTLVSVTATTGTGKGQFVDRLLALKRKSYLKKSLALSSLTALGINVLK